MIDKSKHYFILLHPEERFFGLCFTSSCTRKKWVECEIVEDRYPVDEGYKVTLKALEDGYGHEDFYQMDFISMIESGFIIEKTSETQHVEEIKWVEPLCGSVYLKHSAYIVTD